VLELLRLAADEGPRRGRWRGTTPFISQQVHYSLLARELEHELVPLALDQGVGTLVWSPLSSGLLSGKYRRDAAPPEGSRIAQLGMRGTLDNEHVYRVLDVVDDVAGRTGAEVAQVALAWLLQKAAVTSAIVGARDRDQLISNLGSVDVLLTSEDVALLDQVSARPLPYPYWHQTERNQERLPPVPSSRPSDSD
jgi:aryl-alcohol dehydrogenase-like predicted oxidoreductase